MSTATTTPTNATADSVATDRVTSRHKLTKTQQIVLDVSQSLNPAFMRGSAVRVLAVRRMAMQYDNMTRPLVGAAIVGLVSAGILRRVVSKQGPHVLRSVLHFVSPTDAKTGSGRTIAASK